jgi:putative transcriptional regulator
VVSASGDGANDQAKEQPEPNSPSLTTKAKQRKRTTKTNQNEKTKKRKTKIALAEYTIEADDQTGRRDVNVQDTIELGQIDRPVDELLAAYAAGSLSSPLMALMAAHLELKPSRRAYVAAMEAAYGVLLEDVEPVPLTNRDRRLVEIFASTSNGVAQDPSVVPMVTLNGHHQDVYRNGGQAAARNGQIRSDGDGDGGQGKISVLPASLRRFVGHDVEDLEWRALTSGIKQSVIAAGSFGEASIMRFLAGKRAPAHGHHGLEVTLVLAGGLSDGNGRYHRGDVCVADETVEHQLIAEPGEDCLAFVVRTAPMKVVGTMDRMIQMFLGRH